MYVVVCYACFAIFGELPPDNLARCIVDIGCRIDDRWGFAAEFECHRGQVLCGCRHHDLADLWATGEENVVERQVEQCLRDRGVALADGNPIRREGFLPDLPDAGRSEEHTSELPSLLRTSYAVFCLNKK